MGDKIYTRKGTILAGGGTADSKPIRTYRVPIDTGDEIRINIPYSATRMDLQQAIDHMGIVMKYWEGDGANPYQE